MSVQKKGLEGIVKVLIQSSFNNNISSFDNDDSYPDLELVIPGRVKPLCLHRTHLGLASLLLAGVFKGNNNDLCRFCTCAEKLRVEWTCEMAKYDETYRSVLVKWLRFCYGEDQTFTVGECPAALAVSLQLKLACIDKVKANLETFMVEVAKKNVEYGAEMLLKCGKVYDECHNDENTCIHRDLAKIVLSRENMKNKPVIVDKCLLELPHLYLGMAEYDSREDEFHVRMSYVKYHKQRMTQAEKLEVLKVCDLDKRNSEELKELFAQAAVSDEFSVECCLKSLSWMESELKKAQEQLMRERNKLKNGTEQIGKKLKQAEKERDEERRRNKEREEEVEKMKKEKEDKDNIIRGLEEKLLSVSKDAEKERKEREEQEKTVCELNRKIVDCQNQLITKQEEVTNLESELKSMRTKLELQKDYDKNLEVIQEKEREMKEKESKLKEMEEEIKRVKKKKDEEIERIKKQKDDEIEQTKEENKRQSKKKDEEIERIKKQKDDEIEQTKEEDVQKLKEKDAEIKRMKRENDEEMERIKKENERKLKEKNEVIERTKKENERKLKEMDEEIKRIKRDAEQKLRQKDEEMVRLNNLLTEERKKKSVIVDQPKKAMDAAPHQVDDKNKITIYAKNCTGQSMQLHLYPFDSVKTLKEAIMKSGCLGRVSTIRFDGKILTEDRKLLSEYGITNGVTIFVI